MSIHSQNSLIFFTKLKAYKAKICYDTLITFTYPFGLQYILNIKPVSPAIQTSLIKIINIKN